MDVVEETDTLKSPNEDVDISNISDNEELESPQKENPEIVQRKFLRLPLARVKSMMKTDPECSLISQDSLFLVTKATEMFIEFLAIEAGKNLGQSKRKTVLKRDVDNAIESIPNLCFLDGALE